MQLKLTRASQDVEIVAIDFNKIATHQVGETFEVNPDCIFMFRSKGFTPATHETFDIRLEPGDDEDETDC